MLFVKWIKTYDKENKIIDILEVKKDKKDKWNWDPHDLLYLDDMSELNIYLVDLIKKNDKINYIEIKTEKPRELIKFILYNKEWKLERGKNKWQKIRGEVKNIWIKK